MINSLTYKFCIEMVKSNSNNDKKKGQSPAKTLKISRNCKEQWGPRNSIISCYVIQIFDATFFFFFYVELGSGSFPWKKDMVKKETVFSMF